MKLFPRFSANQSQKPAQAHSTRFLTKHMRKGTCRSAETIKTVAKCAVLAQLS